jgi:hypothetical protein
MAYIGNLSESPDLNLTKCDPSWYSPNSNSPKYGKFGELGKFGEFMENKVDHY